MPGIEEKVAIGRPIWWRTLRRWGFFPRLGDQWCNNGSRGGLAWVNGRRV